MAPFQDQIKTFVLLTAILYHLFLGTWFSNKYIFSTNQYPITILKPLPEISVSYKINHFQMPIFFVIVSLALSVIEI